MVTMMGWNSGSGWVGLLLMSLGMVAFWALVIIAIMALLPGVRGDGTDRSQAPEPEEALRVLDERLARGQLDAQDYRARREMLTHGITHGS